MVARSVASAALLIATLTCLPFSVAQMDLEAAIRDISGWPCADHTWAACPEVVAPGGLEPGPWYELTTWREGDYHVSNADGSGTTYVGEEARVRDVHQLYDALEDRRVARVVVTDPLTFDGDDVPWPTAGYPIQRDVTIAADPACEDTRLNSGGGCTVNLMRRGSLFVVTKDGNLDLRGVRLLDAGGRLGGFVFVQAGGKASFTDVCFEGGEYRRPSTSAPAAAAGGAVAIVNADRPLTPEALAAARAAVAGTTAIDDVALGTPHNVTFTKCAFKKNDVEDGDGGAAWIRTAGLGWVIFDECVFTGNRAASGEGGAVAASGGRVIFAACRFDENIADAGGALMLRDGGLIGGSTFASNHALARGGGAAFVTGDACLVQDSVFEANSAAVEGGAVFVYGRAMFRENAFEGNSAGNTHPDVYACSNADECGAFTRDTATAKAPDPDPFASARRKTAVYERPTEREETETYAGASATSGMASTGTETGSETGSSPSSYAR